MKLIKPDTTATEKWTSKSTEVELEIRSLPSLREMNNIMSNTHDLETFEQNRFVISCLVTKFITKIVDENDKPIKEIPREEIATNGVFLIELDFIEMIPAVLFMELADVCMVKALNVLSGEQVKN